MLVFHIANTTDMDLGTSHTILLYFIGLTTLWITINCSTTEEPDPCMIALPFPRVQHRSTSYNKTFRINDRFIIPGWYGVRDLSIPHTTPKYKHCGTKYPIYLADRPLRNTAQIQIIGTCIRLPSAVCRASGPDVKVKVCSANLLVFYLDRTGVGQTGYCVGSLEGGDIPDFTTLPTVTMADAAQFRFFCNFAESTDEVLIYQAHWYVNNRYIYNSPLTAYNDPANERVLTEAKLTEQGVITVGFDIYCEIRAGRDVNGPAGTPSTSKPIFIGIEVLTPTITVTEGKSGQIRIKATARIGCPVGDNCVYGVTANIPDGKDTCSPTVRTDTACGVNIDPAKWELEYSIKVTGTITEGEYGQQTNVMKITLRSPDHYFVHEIWGNYTLAPVTVNVIKDTKAIEGRKCSATGDPHIRTFGRRGIELQIPGTFTMYQNNDYNIEVQIRSQRCVDRFVNYYCACGVVVRVGQTVFMMNRCSLDYWFIDYIRCDDGGDILDVKKLNGNYKIVLPTGAYIDIQFWYTALNIYIFPSVIDVGVSGGICGNLTGLNYNQQNERVLRSGSTTTDNENFLNSWKTPVDEDMFDTNNLGMLSAWSRNYTTCKCKVTPFGKVANEISCSPYNDPVICNEDDGFRSVHKKRCISPVRKKRSIPTIRFHPENHLRIKRDVSWKNGWTNESANEYCVNLFNSSNLVNLCKDVSGVDITFPMANCVLDIQLSGTNNFSLSAVNSIRSQCLREARMNVTLRQETSPDKPSVLKMVKTVACPAECTKRGNCVNGTCDCNDGYSGPDCSVDLSQPPLVHSLEADGYCDRKDGSCDEIAVFGGPFVESDKFKCQLLSLESNAEVEITNAAVVESVGEVTCPLPVNRQKRSTTVPVIDETVPSYRVAVSNDGQMFSRQLTVVIMNSDCMDCTIGSATVTCSMFDDYCYTDERCYKSGERYIYNDDYQCNNGQWQIITTTTSNGGTTTSKGDPTISNSEPTRSDVDPTSSYGDPTSSNADYTNSTDGTTISNVGTTRSDGSTSSSNGGTTISNDGTTISYGDTTTSNDGTTISHGDDTTTSIVGTISPDGDPTIAYGDTTTSTDGITIPYGDTTTSNDGTTISYGEPTISYGDTTTSTDGTTISYGDTTTSTDGITISYGDTTTSTDGTTISYSDTTTSTDGITISYGDTTTSTDGTTISYGDTTTSTDGITISYGETTASSDGTISPNGDPTISNGDTTSSGSDPTSSDSDPTSSNGDPTSSNGETTINNGGTKSSDGGTSSSNGDTSSSSGGTTSSSGDTASSSGGTTCSSGGTTFSRGGTTSSNEAPTSGDNTDPNGDDTTGCNGDKKGLNGRPNSGSSTQLYSLMIFLCSAVHMF